MKWRNCSDFFNGAGLGASCRFCRSRRFSGMRRKGRLSGFPVLDLDDESQKSFDSERSFPEVNPMSVSNGQHCLQAPAVDWLFAQAIGEGAETGRPAPKPNGHAGPAGPAAGARPDPASFQPKEWPDPPPELADVPEYQKAYRWLQGERQRLDEYTRKQFATIQQQHQALLAQHFRNEEALALRTQELNREMAFFSAQAKIIQDRAGNLARREKALAEQVDKLRQVQRDLPPKGVSPSAAAEAQRVILEELQAETARAQTDGVATHEDLAGVETALKERQAAWEKKQAEIGERLAQMERRYQALEKAEDAARRRLAELDELEHRLEKEFEKQERQLALERRQIETLQARLRLRGIDPEEVLSAEC